MIYADIKKDVEQEIKELIVVSYNRAPQDIEILGWCPVGPVLPHGEKVPL